MSQIAPTKRCIKCAYDLRGITSKVCPECGAPTNSIAIRVSDLQQYHRARAALEQKQLLLCAIAPGGTLGTLAIVHGLPNTDGWLWVDSDRLAEAEDCLDHAGIASGIHSRPIVDRSEPNCAKCGFPMDPNGPEVCPNCGAEFHWVDVTREPLDPTGHQCAQCGYELTGNASGACPECGASVTSSVLPDIPAVYDANDQTGDSPSNTSAILILIFPVWLGLLLLLFQSFPDIVVFLLIFGAAAYVFLIYYHVMHWRPPRT